MHIKTYIDPPSGELTLRLHLDEEDKPVLRDHRNLRHRRVYDATPKDYERLVRDSEERGFPKPAFNPEWVITIGDMLSDDIVLEFPNFARAKTAEETIEKRITQIAKEIAAHHPEPEPEPPPPPPEPEPEEPIIDFPYFDDQTRFEGVWILAQQGAGKTQAMQTLFQRDLIRRTRGERIGLFLMDNQGNVPGRFLHNVTHNNLFAPGGPLHGELIYIRARDAVVGLNLFDLGFPGTSAERFEKTIELLEFILAGLMEGGEFTGQMKILFGRCIQVLMHRPGATIADLSQLLENHKRYTGEIAKCSHRTQAFFNNAQYNNQTKDAILMRLMALENYPDFEQMVSHAHTTFSLYQALSQGKVVVVDTTHSSKIVTGIIGRYFLALLYVVVAVRKDIEEDHLRNPIFVYIDELGSYAKHNAGYFGEIISECRKQKIGVHVAHQNIPDQTDTAIRPYLRSCAIKIANPESYDAATIAGAMGETPWEFVTNLPELRLAVHRRGWQRAALTEIHWPNLGGMPMMGKNDFEELLQEIESTYKYTPPPTPEKIAVEKLAQAREELDHAQRRGDWGWAGQLTYGIIPELEKELRFLRGEKEPKPETKPTEPKPTIDDDGPFDLGDEV